jgi:hypothetical protein
MRAALLLLALPAAPPELPDDPALQAALRATPRRAAEGDDALKKLLVARYNAAVAEAAARADEHRKEMASLPAVCASAAAVFRAEADLAGTPAERVAALGRRAGVLRLAEKTVEGWFDDGGITRAAVLEARYERLSAEIEAERARRQAPR